MAKIKLVANEMLIISEVKKDEFAKVKAHKPEALALRDEKGNETFKLGFNPNGNISANVYGVTFNQAAADGKIYAVVANVPAESVDKQKEIISERYASVLAKLNEVEQQIMVAADEVQEQFDAVAAAIEVQTI